MKSVSIIILFCCLEAVHIFSSTTKGKPLSVTDIARDVSILQGREELTRFVQLLTALMDGVSYEHINLDEVSKEMVEAKDRRGVLKRQHLITGPVKDDVVNNLLPLIEIESRAERRYKYVLMVAKRNYPPERVKSRRKELEKRAQRLAELSPRDLGSSHVANEIIKGLNEVLGSE